ncbi:hypothetical protein KKC94_05625 [Patescibacteria group bacterium]|nr:hypothetical protein [Patescibacteria group bacterium]
MTTIEFLRQYRLFDFAIFDFAISLLAVAILAPLLSKLFQKFRIKVPVINWIFLTVPLSILAHIIAGIKTPLTADFLDPSGHYFIKIIIIALLALSLRGVKIISKQAL